MRKKKVTSNGPGDHGAAESREPARIPRAAVLACIAVIGFAVGYWLTKPPAPLGAPLPDVPKLWEYEGVDVKTSSVLKRRLYQEWLSSLSFQPDGSPPLSYTVESERIEYSIMFPRGTETTTFSDDEFLADGVESQSSLRLDQPLRAVKISAPFRLEGETIEIYASRIRDGMEKEDAIFFETQPPLEMSSYRFITMEYKRTAKAAEMAHFLFIGPLGPRVLVIDFMCLPENREATKPYVKKIMASFVPGLTLKKAMLMEDPTYGEYAGTGLVPEAARKRANMLESSDPQEGVPEE